MTDNSRRTSDGVLVQAGILAAASMIVRIVGLLYRAPLTAIIGDEGNGYYGTAYNIYTIILMVSSYSIPSAISKLIAQKRAVGEYKNAHRVFLCAVLYGLGVGILGSALLYFGAGALVPAVAVPVLRVFAPTIIFFGILAALRGYFQGHGSMVQTSVSQILEQLANAVVSIGAAAVLIRIAAANGADTTKKAQMGASGSALGTGAGVLAALVFMAVCYLKGRGKIRRSLQEDQTGRLDTYGHILKETVLVITPFMLSGFILNLTTSLNQTIYYKIMINLRGMDETLATTLYGIFSNKAVVISNIPISIATAVSSAIIPGISASFAKGDLEDTKRRVTNATRITAMIAIPSFAGLLTLARPVTMLMFPQMESLPMASRLLSLLSVTVVFYSISTITNAALQSIGKMSMPLVSAGIALIVQTAALCLILVTTNTDIYALVIVSVLYSFMIFIVNELFLKKYLGIRRDLKLLFIRPLLCAAVMGAAAWIVYHAVCLLVSAAGLHRAYFVNLTGTAAGLLTAVIVYFFLLIKSRTMTEENLRSLPKGEKIVRFLRKFKWL
ncbi:MAG: polysaccharide biosynthesis protein [Firmicutes bacterium]|nr:polysaccharide biosynthesis protein [Bacillota bacterium]